MKRNLTVFALAACLSSVAAEPAQAQKKNVGACEQTRISAIGSRLDGMPDSGTTVQYENGIYGTSYNRVPNLLRSRVGDPVVVCLLEVPKGCPPGDERGKVYGAINMRTNMKWKLADSSHMCGGA